MALGHRDPEWRRGSWTEYRAARENAFEGGAIGVINKLEVEKNRQEKPSLQHGQEQARNSAGTPAIDPCPNADETAHR